MQMSFPDHMYKAYDIRGIYPEELDEKRAYATARWFADMRFRETGKKEGLVLVVGQDMRLSSPMIAEAVIRGLTEQGAHVVDVGLVSSPTFYVAVADGGFDGGVMITASHNPAEYSGIKLVRDGAEPLSGDNGIYSLRDMVKSGRLPEDPQSIGEVRQEDGWAQRAVANAFTYMGEQEYPKLKVVIDTANSMGAPDMDALFSELGCEVLRMNWELDGTFPAHEADPYKPENCADLMEKVKAVGADIGIALDGDGDRVFFVTELGEIMAPVALKSLLAKLTLDRFPKSKILYDVRPGRKTVDVVKENGGEAIQVRVGHSYFKEKMLETDAKFGGENSGHFFLNFDYGAFESTVTIVLMVLAEIARSGKKLSEIEHSYIKYAHSGEQNFVVKDTNKSIAAIRNHFDAKPNTLDGVSFDLGKVWFNVRASNTEPKLRVNVEGENAEIVNKTLEEIKSVIA